MLKRVSAIGLFLGLYALHVSGTHFRGGIITWKPNSTVSGKVIFSFKLAWRRSREYCDDNTISSSSLVGSGSWSCLAGCTNSSLSTALIYCTSYSAVEDWTLGENTFEHTFNETGPFVIGFTDCCWISTLVAGRDGTWSVPTTIDLSVRKDTGKINSSPISATSPIIRLQHNCSYSIPIHTDDPDGDTVKCRWAVNTGSIDECGGICNVLNGSVLDENACVLHYTPTIVGWHAVALMLNDYPDPKISKASLSAVPLQFLLRVDDDDDGCSSGLKYSPDTPPNSDCVTVEPGKTYSARIGVIETNTTTLREVSLVAPVGTLKSAISGSHPKRHMDVSWTPHESQYGSHVFCFTVTDNTGISLEQRCVTILAGARSPKLVPMSEEPKNGSVDINVFTREFFVTFDEEIRRPAQSRYIHVSSIANGTAKIIATLDTSSSPAILVNNRTLTFYLPADVSFGSLRPNSIHFVSMDRGAVVGLRACASSGAPFDGFHDQTTWSFTTNVPTNHPCASSVRGPCQKSCDSLDGVNYYCYCDEREVLAPNGITCLPDGQPLNCSGNCSGNGVCINPVPELCNCRIGWEGNTCQEPVCYHFAGCSGHGVCVSPDVCSCYAGWGGPACSVDQCSIYKSCSSCTANVGCGWCDTLRRCVPGSGDGPDDEASVSSCFSWHYYDCRVATGGASTCSAHIKTIDCENCQVDVPLKTGSLPYCSAFKQSCSNYATCFTAGDCPSWKETACPLGRPPSGDVLTSTARRRRETNDNDDNSANSKFSSVVCGGGVKVDVTESKAKGATVVEETMKLIADSKIFPPDHGLLRRIAYVESKDGADRNTFRNPAAEAGVGIWQMDKGTFDSLKSQFSLTEKRKEKRRKVMEKFGIDLAKVSRSDLYKPLVAALYARVLLSTFKEAIPKDKEGQAKYWKKYYNTPDGAGTPEKFLKDIGDLSESTNQRTDDCVHGLPDPNKDCKCFCETGWKGPKCDQPDCGCPISPCSKRGLCVQGVDGSANHHCRCSGRAQGVCCEELPPPPVNGDPHLQTIDGVNFDYFDIGVYWGCISRENDFGVQFAFFQHQGTSLVGAVALSVGSAVVAIVSNHSPTGIPVLRINGTQQTPRPGDGPLEFSDAGVRLYLTNDTGFFVAFFQYKNGITYTVESHYSTVIDRQYLNTALGASIVLEGKTGGLCGVMDSSIGNDFTGPDGTLFTDPVDFGDSWRINATASLGIEFGRRWSWNSSNFYPADVSGPEYTDPGHFPRYDLSSYSSMAVRDAQQICADLGLSGTFLENCKLDLVVTGDASFANQSAFQTGVCPNDCSNHGICRGGNCTCFGLWSGNDCSQGGCDACPINSNCVHGFCECKLGYAQRGEGCVAANCSGVNDCTSPLHGICVDTDDCLCGPGYTGSACNESFDCTESCSPNAVCGEGNRCICNPNWSGSNCSIPDCSDLQNCSGHGSCSANATCGCDAGWFGSSCSLPSCTNVNDCSGNGECIDSDRCRCHEGFAPPDCSVLISCSALSNCSGNGVCLSNVSCSCYDGYAGSSCEFPLCSSGCSNQGQCLGPNFCNCNQGWTGSSCSEPSCEEFGYCSGNGICVKFDLCQCDANWTGPSCNAPYCPVSGFDQCHGRGTCIGPGLCSCNIGYAGDLCQDESEPECDDSWPSLRSRWNDAYTSWINSTKECPLLNPEPPTVNSSPTSPIDQWNVMKRTFIASVQSWLNVASAIPGIPTTVPLSESKSFEEQWDTLMEFGAEVNRLWYEYVGKQYGVSSPSLSDSKCENSRLDRWNQYLVTTEHAKDKAADAFRGKCG